MSRMSSRIDRAADEARLAALALRRAGWTAGAVGARLGVSGQTVLNWCNGIMRDDLAQSGEPARRVLAAYRVPGRRRPAS